MCVCVDKNIFLDWRTIETISREQHEWVKYISSSNNRVLINGKLLNNLNFYYERKKKEILFSWIIERIYTQNIYSNSQP